MSKIINLCKVPGDNLGASVTSWASITRPINGEYSATGPYTGFTATVGTPSGGVFNWGTAGTIAACTTQIDAIATALSTTTTGLIGRNVTSPNITGTKTIIALGYVDKGGGVYQPSCWVSAVNSSVSGTVTFGGGTVAGTSTIIARLKGFATAKAVSAMKVWNDRSYRVTNADGTGACKLVAAAPGEGEMNMIATDSAGNTYYVTRLFECLAVVTQKTGSSYQFASGTRVKWNESAAVLNTSVKI